MVDEDESMTEQSPQSDPVQRQWQPVDPAPNPLGTSA
jgi:hypothetical protein